MVRKLSISPEESDLSLPTGEEEKEVKEADPLSSSSPTWSSRRKCLEAYACVVMSFMTTLEHCRIIVTYGSITFLVYLIYAVGLGMPVALVEILLGRYVMGNVIKAWSMCPFAKGVLACLFVTTAYIIYSDNICNAYLFKYLFSFYHGYIPWDDCRYPWAKENCYALGHNTTAFMKCVSQHSESYCRNLKWETSGTQYWKYVAGNMNSSHEICLLAVFMALSAALVALVNLKGHRSCEKAFIVLVYFPLTISLILTFAAYSSPGSLNGIIKTLSFNWSLVFEWRMWLTVFEDFLFCTGLGTLGLSFVSSHGRFKDNIFIDVLVVTFTSIFSSLLTAIPILSVVAVTKTLHGPPASSSNFSYSDKLSNTIIFLKMTDCFLQFPNPNVLWSFLFYLEMILISLANQTVMMLAFCEAIWAIFLEKKFLFNSIVVGIIVFALGIPYLFIEFNFEFPIQTSVITVIFLYAITWQLFYGFKKFNDDFHFMMGYPPSFLFFRLKWIILIPMLVMTLAVKMYFRVPDRPLKYIVFIYVAIPVFIYLFVALVQFIWAAKRGNPRSAFQADPNWGPANSILRMSRVIFDTRAITKEFMYRQDLYRKPLMKPPRFSQQNIVQLT